MNIFIDFETFWSKDYTLKKMSTIEYVRDPRFKILGCGIAVENEEIRYISDIEKLYDFPWESATVIAHNGLFDHLILVEQLGIKPHRYGCTKSLARGTLFLDKYGLTDVAQALGIGSKTSGILVAQKNTLNDEDQKALGEYCKNDVHLCREIYRTLAPLLPPAEHEIIHTTLRWGVEGCLRLDKDLLTEIVETESTNQANIIGLTDYTDKQLRSNQQFEMILRRHGIDVPLKPSPSDPSKQIPALGINDAGFQTLMANNPDFQDLWDARIAAKSNIKLRRSERFLRIANLGNGTLPMPLQAYAAHTYRWGGAGMINVQNLPNLRRSRLREAIMAPEGHQILVADSSQIELRLNMWFCGQWDKLDILANGGDIYRQTAAERFNKPLDKVAKEERAMGKAMCFAADTNILTSNGWKPIIEISQSDKIWDGIEWVTHQGVIQQGIQQTVQYANVKATPDHKILTRFGWKEWQEVHTNPSLLTSALNLASLPSSDGSNVQSLTVNESTAQPDTNQSADVLVDTKDSLLDKISKWATQHAVTIAENWQQLQNDTRNIKQSCLMTSTVIGYSTASAPQSPDALRKLTHTSHTTAAETSEYTQNGVRIVQSFWHTSKHCLAGMIHHWKLIESITNKGISQETSNSSRDTPIARTDELLRDYKPSSTSLWQNEMTYDLVSCGPRNRFVIATANGPMIAHNCLGLGYGMSGAKFKLFCEAGPLGMPPIQITSHEANSIVSSWRFNNKAVVAMWDTLNNIILDFFVKGFTYDITPVRFRSQHGDHEVTGYVHLPNGMVLIYPNLEMTDNGNVTYGHKGQYKLYGARLLENIIQALSRVDIAEKILLIDKRVKTVSSTHDEIIAISPNDRAEADMQFMLETMALTPTWARGLTLAAEGGFAPTYSK